MPASSSRVRVSKLEVTLPNGTSLLTNINLVVSPGEIVVLVGGSGSGKSTLSRALFEPEALEADGFTLRHEALDLDRDELGLVPQRGALFDHLTVGENLNLARRANRNGSVASAAEWLEAVSLDGSLADAATGELSGGQAQRIAVARALAAGRRILFLDEPSAGLDPARVRELARVIKEQVDHHEIAAIVVTHDIALAGGIGDRILFLDPESGGLVRLFDDEWPGPLESGSIPPELRGQWLSRLENEIVDRIDGAAIRESDDERTPSRSRSASIVRAFARQLARPFAIAAAALAALIPQLVSHPRDFAKVAGRIAKQTLLRPLPFYAVVAALIGYTVLFVISKVGGAGVRPDALIRQIGGSYVLALAPPLSAILFVAASGAASNAWLGSLTLTRQVTALRALGIKPAMYLWAPTWLVVGLAYLVVAGLFCASMIAGGWLLATQSGVENAFELLTGDLIDPRPERKAHLARALVLFWIYAWGIASDVVAKGTDRKRSSDSVTKSMTGSVVACTLWVVGWELVTAIWLFRG